MIINYILKEKIFVAIVCRLLAQKKKIKSFVKNYFKINGKQMINMLKNSEYIRLKNCERKIKSSFVIYSDFEIILVQEDHGKQNQNESYKSLVEMLFTMLLIVCSKKVSILLISWENNLTKLLMTKNDNEDFEHSTKYWICNYIYDEGDVKVRNPCHIDCRGSANRDCDINVKLNQ